MEVNSGSSESAVWDDLKLDQNSTEKEEEKKRKKQEKFWYAPCVDAKHHYIRFDLSLRFVAIRPTKWTTSTHISRKMYGYHSTTSIHFTWSNSLGQIKEGEHPITTKQPKIGWPFYKRHLLWYRIFGRLKPRQHEYVEWYIYVVY